MKKMGNRYFSQYLLNKGVLTPDNVGYILPKSAHAVPTIAVLAAQQGFLSDDQAAQLQGGAAAEELLTVAQMENLKGMTPGRDAFIAQCLIDEQITDLVEINGLFRECDGEDVHPVKDAVVAFIGDDEQLSHIVEVYCDYSEMFIGALQRFMNTDAVVLPGQEVKSADGTRMASQGMGGHLSLSAGLMASDDVLLEMARRYSGEDLETVDDMAEDCVAEFINVLNGLFIVNLSSQDFDMDLDMPKNGKNTIPMASNLTSMEIVCDFGKFILYLAEDDMVY